VGLDPTDWLDNVDIDLFTTQGISSSYGVRASPAKWLEHGDWQRFTNLCILARMYILLLWRIYQMSLSASDSMSVQAFV